VPGWLRVLLVALPGGLAIAAAAEALVMYEWTEARKSTKGINCWAIRSRVVTAIFRVWKQAALADPRPFRAMMTIANNEVDPRLPLDAQVGDAALGGGPSVGPWQVYRSTAIGLGLYDPKGQDVDAQRAEYAKLAADLDWCACAAAVVLKSKLEAARGDWSDAIRRYNGSGPDAEAYRARALAFAESQYGGKAFAA